MEAGGGMVWIFSGIAQSHPTYLETAAKLWLKPLNHIRESKLWVKLAPGVFFLHLYTDVKKPSQWCSEFNSDFHADTTVKRFKIVITVRLLKPRHLKEN